MLEMASEPLKKPTAKPPFTPGDRVYEIAHPEYGSLQVVSCDPHPRGGFWMVLRDGNYESHRTSSAYRLTPKGWTEPPERPLSRDELVLSGVPKDCLTLPSDREEEVAENKYVRDMQNWMKRFRDLS